MATGTLISSCNTSTRIDMTMAITITSTHRRWSAHTVTRTLTTLARTSIRTHQTYTIGTSTNEPAHVGRGVDGPNDSETIRGFEMRARGITIGAA